MNLNHIKKKIILTILVVLLCSPCTRAFEENITSEVLNLKAENNILLIDVAKHYPEVRFFKFDYPNKVLIELLDSRFHNQFRFNDSDKKNFLSGINLITDLTVGSAKYEDDKTKVSIILTFNESFKPFPRTISTKDNVIKISFHEPSSVKSIQEISTEQNLEVIKELYNKAVEETINDNVEKSEDLYKEITAKDNLFFPARYNLAKIYFDKEDYDQSQKLLLLLIADIENTKEESADKRLLLLSKNLSGLTYLSQNIYDKAQEQFNEIIKIDPGFYEAHYNLGISYEKIKDIEQAITNFKKTIELKSDYAPAYYHLGILNLILKNKKEAIANLEKVLSLLPESNIGKLSEKELQKLKKRRFKLHT